MSKHHKLNDMYLDSANSTHMLTYQCVLGFFDVKHSLRKVCFGKAVLSSTFCEKESQYAKKKLHSHHLAALWQL